MRDVILDDAPLAKRMLKNILNVTIDIDVTLDDVREQNVNE